MSADLNYHIQSMNYHIQSMNQLNVSVLLKFSNRKTTHQVSCTHYNVWCQHLHQKMTCTAEGLVRCSYFAWDRLAVGLV